MRAGFSPRADVVAGLRSCYRMCSLDIECVLFGQLYKAPSGTLEEDTFSSLSLQTPSHYFLRENTFSSMSLRAQFSHCRKDIPLSLFPNP